MPSVYLDSASAEALHPAARDVLLAAFERGYADPRRLHGPGRDARLLLDNAREVVAEALGMRREEVVFTASGTDAVHLAVEGIMVNAGGRDSVTTTQVEHQSVTDVVGHCSDDERWVAVDRLGRVSPDQVVAACDARTALVAVQHANHEVGTIQPVAEIAARVGPVPVFVDACASMGRLPLPEGWSLAAGSAHKWGGPPGVGVLLVRRGTSWAQPRPGLPQAQDHAFTNVPGALAAAAALQAVVAEREQVGARQRALVDRIRAAAASIPDVEVVGDPVDRLPHLVTFSCLYVDGEALVTELDRRGFGVASGSACAVDTREPSHVLRAMGVLTHGNLRVSLTRDTTEEDVDGFLAVLPGVVRDIRAEAGL